MHYCVLVGGRNSTGETAAEGTCGQASFSIFWWQPKKAVYGNSSFSQASNSISSKLITIFLIHVLNNCMICMLG